MLECLIGPPKKSNILHVNKKIQNIINYMILYFVKRITFICILHMYMPLKKFFFDTKQAQIYLLFT